MFSGRKQISVSKLKRVINTNRGDKLQWLLNIMKNTSTVSSSCCLLTIWEFKGQSHHADPRSFLETLTSAFEHPFSFFPSDNVMHNWPSVFSICGYQNSFLLVREHNKCSHLSPVPTEIRRAALAKVTWKTVKDDEYTASCVRSITTLTVAQIQA